MMLQYDVPTIQHTNSDGCFALLFILQAPCLWLYGLVLNLPYTCAQAENDYVDTWLSFSSFPLSGSVAAGKLTCAFEELWGIL
jgi:hypothetical protein